jgi:hypothetical protein
MIDDKFKVRRFITEFLKQTEELLAEYDLCSFELSNFQIEFGEQNTENPMFDCYPIKEKNVEFLKRYMAEEPEWDFVNKSYFIEAHAI